MIREQNIHILPCGYAAEKARAAFERWIASNPNGPDVLFINSTISLEGILPQIDTKRADGGPSPIVGCFDWDPFAARIGTNFTMVKQDVATMLDALFELIEERGGPVRLVQVPTIA